MFRLVKEICVAGAVVDIRIIGCNTSHNSFRESKHSPTAEAVQKNNDRIAVRRLSRLINANFFPGDCHLVLTYTSEPSKTEAKKELKNFIRRMKREFKKKGKEMRYITVTEHLNKRIHHHVIMSCIDLSVINRQWRHGIVRVSLLDKTRNYRKLAEYLVKETTKTFRNPDSEMRRRYSAGQNMTRPRVLKIYTDGSILNNPPIVIDGYILDEDSIRSYDHPVTGITHQSYCMVSLEPTNNLKRWQIDAEDRDQETFQRFNCIRQLELKSFPEADYSID